MKWKQNTLLNAYVFFKTGKQAQLILQEYKQLLQSNTGVIDSNNTCKYNDTGSIKNKNTEHQKTIFSWFVAKTYQSIPQ